MHHYIARSIAALLLLLTSLGCEDVKKPSVAAPKTEPAAVPKETPKVEGDAKMATPAASKTVKVSAAESASHGLPPAEISVDLGQHAFSTKTFAAKDNYLSLSGPPGGPLGLQVEHIQNAPKDDAAWRKLAETRFAERKPIEMGSAAEVSIASGKNVAFTCTTGESLARAHHLLVTVPVPKTSDGILVDFKFAAAKTKTPTPQAVMSESKFGDLLRSLSIRVQ